MKRRKISEDITTSILPIDEEQCGGDFHNPMFDSKLVHSLGRFNQSFALFRATYIDEDTLKLCKKQVGRKRGPFASPIELPLETTVSECLFTALENLKEVMPSHEMNIPALFVMTAQNFEKFEGVPLYNMQSEMLLQSQFKMSVLQVETMVVEGDSMFENYVEVGQKLTVVYLFNW